MNTSKEQLLENLNTKLEALEQNGGIISQGNAMVVRNTIKMVEQLTEEEAETVDMMISTRNNESIKSAKKWGWNPVLISPIDYAQFITEVNPSIVMESVEELSSVWYD